jgi:hypothetical protein
VGRTEWIIDVMTPLGCRVLCSREGWEYITTVKHPPMQGRHIEVAATLSDPDEVRRSQRDPDVLLFHRWHERRWICAVAVCAGPVGRLITAYPADKIKRGVIRWTR